MKLTIMILLLATLISCGKITKVEYITTDIPDVPSSPVYYKVDWIYKDSLYCMTEQNAKNLMKNKSIQDGYTNSLIDILKSMKVRNDLYKTKK